jgi:UDP-N-acetylmuramoyl-tripeptide--D-alanyl-D-alanine ligase
VAVPDQDRAIELLGTELRAGDVVLVKGSRYRTWEVADALRAGAGGAGLAGSPSPAGGAGSTGSSSPAGGAGLAGSSSPAGTVVAS